MSEAQTIPDIRGQLYLPELLVPKTERTLMLPDQEVARARIVAILEGATAEDIALGESWYQDAHNLCAELAEYDPSSRLTQLHVAGIVAALSPMQSWSENIRRARQVVETGTSGGLGHAIESAKLIWHGFDPEYVIGRTGQNYKVQSFFQNIARPLLSTEVTIDRHMWSLLCDDPDAVKKAGLAFKFNEYQWATERFREVANSVGYLPHQVQSIAWLAWRRKKGITDPKTDQNQGTLDLV